MNESIKELHETLIAQHAALADKLGEETDVNKAKAIVMEMQEVLHRIDIAQNLLFRSSSAALTKGMEKVREADTKLSQAIAAAEKVGDFVKATGEFLKVVDKALDLAKTLAIV
jgi:hypothetical protein